MFADLDLLRKVWQNTANPIWASDHPINTTIIKKGSV